VAEIEHDPRGALGDRIHDATPHQRRVGNNILDTTSIR
jgi:hypothetical protein